MPERTVPRWLAGAGVTITMLGVCVSPAAAAVPVRAQAAVPVRAQAAVPVRAQAATVGAYATDLLLTPGGSGRGYASASLGHNADRLVADLDYSALAGFATVELVDPAGWDCIPSGTGQHCVRATGGNGYQYLEYRVTAASGAEPGRSGQLVVTFTAGDDTGRATAKVTVAEAVDLSTDPRIGVSVESGGSGGLRVPVHNHGRSEVDGAVLVLSYGDLPLTFGALPRNCTLYDPGAPHLVIFAECVFDQKLAPGATYRLSRGVPVSVGESARTGRSLVLSGQWLTPADWDQVDDSWNSSPPQQGTGPEITLVRRSGAERARIPQTDVDSSDNLARITVTVTGDNPADLKVTGGTASGTAGSRVPIRLELKNLGPATVEDDEFAPVPAAFVTVPPGSTAVAVSGYCAPLTASGGLEPGGAGKPGAARYGCRNGGMAVGEARGYDFTFRVDRVIRGATGTFSAALAGDPNPRNDKAKIILNPAGGGGGGGLPITGSAIGPVLGAGVALLLLGLGGVLVGRRRRTSFRP